MGEGCPHGCRPEVFWSRAATEPLVLPPASTVPMVFMNRLRAQPSWLTTLISISLLLLLWQLLVVLGGYDRFILPGPLDVWRQFLIVAGDGRLLRHTAITVSEVLPGLLLGVVIATPLGYLLAKSPLAE